MFKCCRFSVVFDTPMSVFQPVLSMVRAGRPRTEAVFQACAQAGSTHLITSPLVRCDVALVIAKDENSEKPLGAKLAYSTGDTLRNRPASIPPNAPQAHPNT
jgi:hypothetical protein